VKQNYFPSFYQAAIPDAGNHVLGSYIKSKDIEKVQEECEKFVTEVLKINQQ